jgi:hypothetical protein
MPCMPEMHPCDVESLQTSPHVDPSTQTSEQDAQTESSSSSSCLLPQVHDDDLNHQHRDLHQNDSRDLQQSETDSDEAERALDLASRSFRVPRTAQLHLPSWDQTRSTCQFLGPNPWQGRPVGPWVHPIPSNWTRSISAVGRCDSRASAPALRPRIPIILERRVARHIDINDSAEFSGWFTVLALALLAWLCFF